MGSNQNKEGKNGKYLAMSNRVGYPWGILRLAVSRACKYESREVIFTWLKRKLFSGLMDLLHLYIDLEVEPRLQLEMSYLKIKDGTSFICTDGRGDTRNK